jgi:hypothetical protein
VCVCFAISNHAPDSCPGPAAVSALSYTALAVTASPTYSNSMRCSVTVGGVNGGVPALNFTSFSTERDYDFVWLFDGMNTSALLLGRYYSGTQLVERVIVGSSGTHDTTQLDEHDVNCQSNSCHHWHTALTCNLPTAQRRASVSGSVGCQ